MGWASASEIFDPVARELICLGADRDTKEVVLGTLIDILQANDWDTEYESLCEFQDEPVVVQLFAERGIWLDDEYVCNQSCCEDRR